MTSGRGHPINESEVGFYLVEGRGIRRLWVLSLGVR